MAARRGRSQARRSGGGSNGLPGWAWLVMRDGRLEIMKTANADTPIAHGITPLLTVDVWEHAYYLEYQNARGDYLDAFMGHLVNWNFVNAQLA